MSGNRALVQYLAKLERRGALEPDDREAILGLPGVHREYGPNDIIIPQNADATHCILVESGFVSRVKTLESGSRQIVAFHLPGDAVDLQSIMFVDTDHTIQTHTPARTYWIPHRDILDLTVRRPAIARSLWLDTLIDASIFRDWTANVGQRRAQARIAHLMLELGERFRAIGMVRDDSFELPITQVALAEALGLSLVHLNKSLQALRHEGYFRASGRRVSLKDVDKIAKATGFDPSYLHLDSSLIKGVEEPIPA